MMSNAYQAFGCQQQYIPFVQSTNQPSGAVSEQEMTEKKAEKRREGSFEFPEGGWECSKCQNYNFKGRKECHRCKKPKSSKD